MYKVHYGGKKGKRLSLTLSTDMVVVRTKGGPAVAPQLRSREAAQIMSSLETVAHFPHSGVQVFRTRAKHRCKQRCAAAMSAFEGEKMVRFAGKVLRDRKSKCPVVYTENAFVKFHDEVSVTRSRKIMRAHGLRPTEQLEYAENFWFARPKEGCGLRIFEMCESLLEEEHVELCHPELIRPARRWTASPNQWHLKNTTIGGKPVKQSANVQNSWRLSKGNKIVIAVIDDGVDVTHPEFGGRGKVVFPRDVTQNLDSALPYFGYDNHGTACAGVACANGTERASGVAPGAKLMPIRNKSELGAKQEADAFKWAADHGADVISCSWGPPDGDPYNPKNPPDTVALSDHTRLAIKYAIDKGRGGKGCVITWAAGNGNCTINYDGYTSNDLVIAVAACNDRGKRSYYSNFGKAVWCCFPSSDKGPPAPLTHGIWTTDRTEDYGYNPNEYFLDDNDTNYLDAFGGTSSSCPGVAGVAALVLARNPNLRWDQVKDILKQACVQIDKSGGAYDAQGHSDKYGYGRVDARAAVKLADTVTNS